MKLTKETLKQIIKEELDVVLNEKSVYGPKGDTEVLDPNATDEYTLKRFKDFGIRNPKQYAQERLNKMQIAKPKQGNYRWSYIIPLAGNESGRWGWQLLDNLRDEMAPGL